MFTSWVKSTQQDRDAYAGEIQTLQRDLLPKAMSQAEIDAILKIECNREVTATAMTAEMSHQL